MSPGEPSVSARWTARAVAHWTRERLAQAGSPNPRMECDRILCHVLGIDRLRLYLDWERPLNETERDAMRAYVRRRLTGEPVAYVLGFEEFYGRRFRTDPRVLIPRPETEELVAMVLKPPPDLEPGLPTKSPLHVLDVGCGAGPIGLTVAAERPLAHVCLADISADALAVAQENAAALGVGERVRFRHGSVYEALAPGDGPFDAILSNPPYVRRNSPLLAREVADFEPHVALFGGDDGLAVIRALFAGAVERLVPGGLLAFELGFDEGEEVLALARATAGLTDIQLRKDLAGRDRILWARRSR